LSHSTKNRLQEDLLQAGGSPSYATQALLQNLAEARARARDLGGLRGLERPFVTVAYAQSLDGSITIARGQRYTLSGPASMQFAHVLRATHDGILVGVGTVLADDPELTVRLVAGPDPQRVVVDSRLRTPDQAKLLTRPHPGGGRSVWIATTSAQPQSAGANDVSMSGGDGAFVSDDVRRSRTAHLESRGARILDCPARPDGWVDLGALLRRLASEGIAHVMVEGGSRIITSLIEAQQVDYLIVTVVPQLLGGLPAFAPLARLAGVGAAARVERWVTARLGDDVVLGGALAWPAR
jgi:riboflavin biosynthesis pyrimidine reductase